MKTVTIISTQTMTSKGAKSPDPEAESGGLLMKKVISDSSRTAPYVQFILNSGNRGINATATSASYYFLNAFL